MVAAQLIRAYVRLLKDEVQVQVPGRALAEAQNPGWHLLWRYS